jgi:protein SCO1
MRGSAYSAVVLLALAVHSASASGSAPDDIAPPPATYQANAVNVVEQLGAHVPGDTAFRTQDGVPVSLASVLAGDLPTILTFNYSDCPMLCSLQLNGLTAALPKLNLKPGKQFRIVTISLEPNESLDKLTKMRERYVARFPEDQRATVRAGWTYLTGDEATVRRVAQSVGFAYTYIPDRAEWAHPAALIFLSSRGTVTRYVYGIEYEPSVLTESIVKAGTAEPTTAVGFMNRCYHYDPDAKNHSRAGVLALRYGAAGFLVLLVGAFGVLHLTRKRARREEKV